MSTIAERAGNSGRAKAGHDESRLTLLYQVAEQVNSTLELHQCLDRIIDGAYRLFEAETVSLMLMDDSTNEMRIAAARNVSPEVMRNARVKPGEGLAGKVALTGEPLVVSNVEDDPRLRRKNKEQYRTGSFAIIPLRIKDRVTGVLNMANRRDGDPFSQEDLALLTALANQAAIAIENSRLIAQINSEKEQLKRTAFESNILFEVSSSIRYGLGYQHLISLLSASVHKLLDYDVFCSLLVLNGEEDFETRVMHEVPEPCVDGVKRLLLEDLVGRPHSPIVGERVKALRPQFSTADSRATCSFIAVPLEVAGLTVGMILVTSSKQYAFSHEDEVLLKRIVQRMAETVHNLQETIRGEQEKMQAMVSSMAEGVVMFDAEGEIVVLNPPARRFLGLSQHQEFSTESFFRSIVWKEMAEFLAMPLGEDASAKEFSTNGHNGSPRTFNVEMMPVKNETDRRLGHVGIIRDITAERELEQMKSDFVAVVSHELRTPLSSIKMLVSNLLDGIEGELGEGHRASLTRVANNVDRLSRLINDLLDLAKLESGKVQVKFKPLNVPHSLQSILENFKCAAQEKQVEVSLSASNLPTAWADTDKFEQLVTNLVSNALRFAPSGGHVKVSASVRPLDTPERIGSADSSPLSGEGHLVVTVQDDGPGIPDGDLERVFDKFYQVDHSMTRKTGGTGLGLPICREIVSKHGGSIWAQNAPSGGAVFTFELPLDARKHDRAALQGAMEREIRRARRYGTPFSVLMIDVDDFTVFNEHHGYPTGDVALLQLHEMLKEQVKKLLRKKIRETDIVGRFGGDEFVVIAPETDDAGGHAFAERLRKLLEGQVYEIGGQQLKTTMSTGVGAFTDEVDAPVTMLRRSAEALATAKRTGKNKVS